MVPKVFESLKFYCIFFNIRGTFRYWCSRYRAFTVSFFVVSVLSGFVMFHYILFPVIIDSAYSECGTTPGVFDVLTVLADLRLDGLQPVPSTCQGRPSELFCFAQKCALLEIFVSVLFKYGYF